MKASQLFFLLLVIPQVGTHQALPETPVIRHREVEELVNDDVIR
jgi:hypothetical protein